MAAAEQELDRTSRKLQTAEGAKGGLMEVLDDLERDGAAKQELMGRLSGFQFDVYRQHVCYLRFRIWALLQKQQRMAELYKGTAAQNGVVQEEWDQRRAIMAKQAEEFRRLRLEDARARHQIQLVALQQKLMRDFLLTLPTKFPGALDMDELYDYTAKKCGVILPGFAFYIGVHDQAARCLRYQYASLSASDELLGGGATRSDSEGLTAHCLRTRTHAHVPDVHAQSGALRAESLTSRGVTPGDFYAHPIVTPDGQAPAIFACDTCQSNRVTGDPDNVPLNGVDADGVRHMLGYQRDFFAKVVAILSRRAGEIGMSELAGLRCIGKDPHANTPLQLYEEAVRVIHDKVGPESNVYVSLLDSLENYATVVAQRRRPGSRHTDMVGKYLSRARSRGVTFDFCEKRHRTDPGKDNHVLVPNEALDPDVVPYFRCGGRAPLSGARSEGGPAGSNPDPPPPPDPPKVSNPSFSNLRFWGKVLAPKAPFSFLPPEGVFFLSYAPPPGWCS